MHGRLETLPSGWSWPSSCRDEHADAGSGSRACRSRRRSRRARSIQATPMARAVPEPPTSPCTVGADQDGEPDGERPAAAERDARGDDELAARQPLGPGTALPAQTWIWPITTRPAATSRSSSLPWERGSRCDASAGSAALFICLTGDIGGPKIGRSGEAQIPVRPTTPPGYDSYGARASVHRPTAGGSHEDPPLPRLSAPAPPPPSRPPTLMAGAGSAQTPATSLHFVSTSQKGAGFMPKGGAAPGRPPSASATGSPAMTPAMTAACAPSSGRPQILCTIQVQLSKGTLTVQGMLPERCQRDAGRDHRRHRRLQRRAPHRAGDRA